MFIQIRSIGVLLLSGKFILTAACRVDAERISLHETADGGVVGAGAVVVQVQGVVVEDVQFAAGEGIWVAVQARSSEFVVRSKDVDFSINIVFAAFGDCAVGGQQRDGAVQVVVGVVEVARAVVHHQHLVDGVAEDKIPVVRLHTAGNERLYRYPLVVIKVSCWLFSPVHCVQSFCWSDKVSDPVSFSRDVIQMGGLPNGR